jgi:outer membrane receptor protein involved in Fe transport
MNPALGFLVALLFTGASVAASTKAALTGKVTDRNGQPLPGATVVLRNATLDFPEQGTLTNSNGEYRFADLPPGEGYRLTVSLSGHATLVMTDLVLEPGRSEEQNLVLRPESEMKEIVRIQAKSQTLDTEKVTASTVFSSSFIAELPLLGRDYQDVLVLAPGVTDVDKTGNPNIHGARDTDVITLVDGVSTTDPFTGYYGQNLNIESIQELEVITSAATAQYSRAQGGFASILTKSGGNEFQGTFKFYARSDRLDGDGAGVENPELSGGLKGDKAYTDQHFTDLMPFLSLSGAMVQDKLWYYLSLEYIHQETPVNAVTHAFVLPVYGNRGFGKLTWQLAPSHKLAFSLILDKTREENLGIDSLTNQESGYTFARGGPTYTLKESSVFRPTMILESTLSWFDNRFSQTPTTSLDTNGNGILFVDDRPELGGNQNGILEASERDPGEDWDGNGAYKVYEDLEDLDGDGWIDDGLTICEGYQHEDQNCNGYIDAESDANLNGVLDPAEDSGIPCNPEWLYCPGGTLAGTAHNGRMDTEDRNGNGVLDVVGTSGYTPFPFWKDTNGNGIPDAGEFRAPLPADRDLVRDNSGRLSGPSPFEYHDHRTRLSWAEDLSFFINDAGGTHDVKLGLAYENEGYNSDTLRMPIYTFPTGIRPLATPGGGIKRQVFDSVLVSMAVPPMMENSASGRNLGLYLQDSWKPIPNLTLGLGVRFDFEEVSSEGFSSFDPVAERRTFDNLMGISGFDSDPYDRVTNPGLCLDPIHSCLGSSDIPLQTMNSSLRTSAFNRLTRSNLDFEVYSSFLKGITGGSTSLPSTAGPIVQPESIDITNSNLAPRLSLSWDPWADGKTMVFGSWGRYYDKLFLNALTLEQGPDTVARTYLHDSDNVDYPSGLPNHDLGTILSQSSVSSYQIDRSLATPYSDEWTAGFRRELAPEVLISLRYIHRDFHDQLQDIDVNHELRFDPATGKPADRFGEPTCYSNNSTNFVCENIPNGAPDLYVQNLYFNRILRLGNTNEQNYHAWEFEILRRLSRKWEMQASYTYSVAQGDAESYLSILGNDPALAEFEPGYLNYDQRHVVKFNAVAFLPRDWRLGGTITWASGLPFSAIVHYNDLDNAGYIQARILYGQLGINGYGITPENRNIHRNLASYLLNARVTKNFAMGKSSAAAFLEVYNLLNDDALRVRYIDQVPATVVYTSQRGQPIIRPPTSEVVGERDFGRRFQIGIQINF